MLRSAQRVPKTNFNLFRQFGVTNVLVEGSSHFDMQQNLDSGEALMRAILAYYHGLRPGG